MVSSLGPRVCLLNLGNSETPPKAALKYWDQGVAVVSVCLMLTLNFLLSSAAFPHRLNLFYLANDVIQNCKRKNAIVFRDTFAEVLPEAASLVK